MYRSNSRAPSNSNAVRRLREAGQRRHCNAAGARDRGKEWRSSRTDEQRMNSRDRYAERAWERQRAVKKHFQQQAAAEIAPALAQCMTESDETLGGLSPIQTAANREEAS